MKVVPENLHYEMRIGDDYKYELRCGVSKTNKVSPFIITKTGDEMNVNKDDSAFVAFLVRLNMVIEKIPKMIKDKYGQGDIRM